MMMRFLSAIGVDMSQLAGIVGQQPALFEPYQILSLSRDCSDEQVKLRYREIMTKIHPDKTGPETTFLDSIVNSAYQVIRKERGMS